MPQNCQKTAAEIKEIDSSQIWIFGDEKLFTTDAEE
jgi:hypothetical protein